MLNLSHLNVRLFLFLLIYSWTCVFDWCNYCYELSLWKSIIGVIFDSVWWKDSGLCSPCKPLLFQTYMRSWEQRQSTSLLPLLDTFNTRSKIHLQYEVNMLKIIIRLQLTAFIWRGMWFWMEVSWCVCRCFCNKATTVV